MSWTDENEPTTNNESTSYEKLKLAFAKLQREHGENNELSRLDDRRSDQLEKIMDDILNEEQITNKNYHSKTLRDIENGAER